MPTMWKSIVNCYKRLKARKRCRILSNKYAPKWGNSQWEEILVVKTGFGPWLSTYERILARTLGGDAFVKIPWRAVYCREIVSRQDMERAQLTVMREYEGLDKFVEENFVDLL